MSYEASPAARPGNQSTAQTISAVPAAVQPVAQGDGEIRQTAADLYNAAIGSLPALSGQENSIAALDMSQAG